MNWAPDSSDANLSRHARGREGEGAEPDEGVQGQVPVDPLPDQGRQGQVWHQIRTEMAFCINRNIP